MKTVYFHSGHVPAIGELTLEYTQWVVTETTYQKLKKSKK